MSSELIFCAMLICSSRRDRPLIKWINFLKPESGYSNMALLRSKRKRTKKKLRAAHEEDVLSNQSQLFERRILSDHALIQERSSLQTQRNSLFCCIASISHI